MDDLHRQARDALIQRLRPLIDGGRSLTDALVQIRDEAAAAEVEHRGAPAGMLELRISLLAEFIRGGDHAGLPPLRLMRPEGEAK